MAMTDKVGAWIEAGAILGSDPTAKVMCPTCSGEFLRVEDHPHTIESRLVDRYLPCEACGATEVLVRADRGR